MGIFDTWRRKKPDQHAGKAPATARDIMRAGLTKTPTSERPLAEISRPSVRSPVVQSEMNSLLAEYERLIQRREAIRAEGEQLQARLDRGEITAQEWRKNLMARTLEAAQLSDKLRVVTARLKWLGYTGLLA